MANRELVVLGTAAATPTVARNQSSYALRWNDQLFVFDPGESTQRQMMLAGLSVARVNRIFITHFHGDHCLGLPGLVQRWRLAGGVDRMSLHYPTWGRDHIDRLLSGSAIDFDLHIDHEPFDAGETRACDDLRVTALALDHTIPAVGWRLEEPARRHMLPEGLAALGIEGADIGRLDREGHLAVGGREVAVEEVSEIRPGPVFAFVMDTRPCEGARELARDADLVVMEATYLDEHADLAARNGHLTASQAATIAHEAGARRLVLSHFSERYDDYGLFTRQAAAIHSDVIAANDLDVIEVPTATPRRRRC